MPQSTKTQQKTEANRLKYVFTDAIAEIAQHIPDVSISKKRFARCKSGNSALGASRCQIASDRSPPLLSLVSVSRWTAISNFGMNFRGLNRIYKI